MESKPGWKTTEFWMALLLPPVIAAVNQIFGMGIDPTVIAGMFGITIPGYAISRGIAKGPIAPTE